jgi:hypothetical protein
MGFPTGEAHYNWKGGVTKHKQGYIFITAPGHPRAKGSGGQYVFEHILIAEKALGHYLPDGAVVHHLNEINTDNRPENLVICPSSAYHNLIHQRTRAYKASGHADWRMCTYCKQYDSPENLYIGGTTARHKACATKSHNEYMRKRRLSHGIR